MFEKLGVQVIGASADGIKANDKFRRKHALQFPVLCDNANKDLCRGFGVWQPKKLAGVKFEGVVRATFVIAADGTVEKVYAKVSPLGHASDVLAYVRGG